MLARLLFMSLCLLGFQNLRGQVVPDSLTYVEHTMSFSIWQGPIKAGPNRINILMKDCSKAEGLYKDARASQAGSSVLAMVGAVTLAAWAGNYAFNDMRGSFVIPAAGLVMMGLSIPLNKGALRKAEESIFYYNRNCLGK